MRSVVGALVDHHAVVDVEIVSGLACRIEAGGGEHVLAQRLAGLPRGFAADAGGARRPGAAAIGRVVGVAHDRRARLSSDTPKDEATHCAITASAPWPCSETPVWQKIAPVASSFTVRAVLRRDARAADAVERCARIGDLDEADAKPMPR